MTIDTATLELILTGAGVTVAATIIASLIEILKRVIPGDWLDNGHEGLVAFILSGVLVGYAYIATTPVPDPVNGFAAFLAFVGIAGLSTKAYDAGAAVKAALPTGSSIL